MDEAIREITKRYALVVERELKGRVGDHIALCRSSSGEGFYLKLTDEPDGGELRREADRLLWMWKFLPVPEVLDHGLLRNRIYYLLMKEISGRPAHESGLDEKTLVERLAGALHQIHGTPVSDCPFLGALDQDLAEAGRNCANVSAGREQMMTHWEILTGKRAIISESYFTHGDACLPNFLMLRDVVVGIIDVAAAGVGDIHRDLAAAARSVEVNFGKGKGKRLLSAYGLDNVDQERLKYYHELNRLLSARSLRILR